MKKIKSILVLVVGIVFGIAFVYSCGSEGGGNTAIGVSNDELQAQIDSLSAGLLANSAAIDQLTTTVSALQNTGLSVYDNDGQYLGILVDGPDEPFIYVYNKSINRFIGIVFTTGNLSDPNRGGTRYNTIFYASVDCTGTPYLYHNGTEYVRNGVYRVYGGSKHYTAKNGASLGTYTLYSRTDDGVICTLQTNTDVIAIEAKEITLPFTVPVTFPINYVAP